MPKRANSFMKNTGLTLLGAVLTLSIQSVFSDNNQRLVQSFDEYKQLLDAVPVLDDDQAEATTGVMARSALAHLQRDADASMAELSEDYSWNKATPSGMERMASGLEITARLTKELYESDFFDTDNYFGLKTTPIAIIGNLGIQYEQEEFLDQAGLRRKLNMLTIYEIKDGELWRLWSFEPFLRAERAAGND